MASRIEEYEGVDRVLKEVASRIRASRKVEAVPTAEAYGRVVSVDVRSPTDVPGVSRSHMDGFAVLSRGLASASRASPVRLTVRGEVGPSPTTRLRVGPGETVRVATGAPIPSGADAVIPVEKAVKKKGRVVVDFAPAQGSWVYARGSDIKKGEVVLRKGWQVRAQDVGMLMSLGKERLRVFARPRVAVLATGSELTDDPSERGRVRNSHSPVFLKLLEALGCQALDEGIARDVTVEVSGRIRRALRRSDFVITLGGTSVGRRDVVEKAASRLGPEVMFHGVRMDRGRVTGVAVVRGKPVLMMPGPVQGAMNAFLLFGVPIVHLFTGSTGGLPSLAARLGSSWKARDRFSGFTKVVYVRLRGDGQGVADPVTGDTESLSVLTRADGFVVVPEDVTQIEEGAKVEVRLLPGFSFT